MGVVYTGWILYQISKKLYIIYGVYDAYEGKKDLGQIVTHCCLPWLYVFA